MTLKPPASPADGLLGGPISALGGAFPRSSSEFICGRSRAPSYFVRRFSSKNGITRRW